MAELPIPRWAGIALLLAIATFFGSNHVAARVAFEHGANVTTAIAVRSTGTALALFALLAWHGISPKIPGRQLLQAACVGLLLAVQSYCLYSAVARIPVALALLAFSTFPIMYALLSWATGGERPRPRALCAMPVAFAGLVLALDVAGIGGGVAERWRELGAGVLWAIGGAIAFVCALFLTTRWLGDIDGRLRSFLIMSTVAVSVLAGGGVAGDFRLPVDGTGWVALALLTVFYGAAITATFVLLPRLGAVNNSMVLNFEPIAVLGIGWVVLGQAVTAPQAAGALIVVGAIVSLLAGKK